MMIAALLFYLAAAAPQDGVTLAELIGRQSTAEVAAALRIPDAARAARHELQPADMMAPPRPPGSPESAQVKLFLPAEPLQPGVCRREVVLATARRTGPSSYRTEGRVTHLVEIALADVCEQQAGRFAHLNPGLDASAAGAALVRLRSARQAARADRASGLHVTCVSEVASYVCPADPARVLADLPLERTYLIESDRESPGGVRLAATEGRPGDVMWSITLQGDKLTLTREIPAPF